ncbi:hypothetical protein JMUB590_0274 [Staphylococcus caprae]|uniref:Uncharacterized protein n=1 Tax=Staphylococcus caprae TaxID=29380 RepID=A0ABM7FQF5_9STAP|nr:hypothetical protein JMUB145_0289 [Staphylococcus caprae]BBD91384.1 hypothetical protein JMUB590_0274 [Staphylococcus caprae]BBD93887.1 hypothetical protein JMUB898_0267 [Staphylococcus caprae]SUL94477.1 Uncharacterised protein [Staphylococcus caprae]
MFKPQPKLIIAIFSLLLLKIFIVIPISEFCHIEWLYSNGIGCKVLDLLSLILMVTCIVRAVRGLE